MPEEEFQVMNYYHESAPNSTFHNNKRNTISLSEIFLTVNIESIEKINLDIKLITIQDLNEMTCYTFINLAKEMYQKVFSKSCINLYEFYNTYPRKNIKM